MRVDCEGCAGCCVDWRALAPEMPDHERVGPDQPLDDTYNLVPLTRDEVRAFVDAGLGDALAPRLWTHAADGDEQSDSRRVAIGGFDVAAVQSKPVFFVGLRKAPKPVAPVGSDEPAWLPACAFLDPDSLQCRIHGDVLYPDECATYPGRNLRLDVATECERVEAHTGEPGSRLIKADAPADATPLFGPQALGGKVFVHPDPDALEGRIERLAGGETTPEDRAEFVGTAAGASPGTLSRNDDAYREYRDRALAADSWVGAAIDEWQELADGADGNADARPALGERVEDDRGAPSTPGWD